METFFMRVEGNIEKFDLQIIRKETDKKKKKETNDRKVVNRLESNSIKEINLIGF